MTTQPNKYVIVREDLVQDPLTIISEGLLIGRLHECELLLNHPSVSRAQAGIRAFNNTYHLFNLRPTNPPKLNGAPIERNSVLAPGDLIEMGPFLLEIDRRDDALVIKVTLQIGSVVTATDDPTPSVFTTKQLTMEAASRSKAATPRAAPLPGDKALDIFWDKRIREAGKMVRLSALFPRSQKKSGKTQFNWTPTSDLSNRWPVPFIVWGAVAAGLLSVAAAYWYTSAFTPGPVSNAHTRSSLLLRPAIAVRANANSCTSCHSFRGKMENNCAACHNAEGFAATVIEPHKAAGIGCVSCHAEHRGADFNPTQGAAQACTGCHNNSNHETYNGRKVGTPHNGTFGYPVANGKWIWTGLSDDDWKLKQVAIMRAPADTDEVWRSKQFHALHVQRVRAPAGQKGNLEGELSCSSCHKSFNPIDRQTPRTTCAGCHNSKVESATTIVAATQPNCLSCHVQHVKSPWHWDRSQLAKTN